MTSPGPRVFVCYQRDDAAGYAGRVYDALAARWGDDRVSMDVDTLHPDRAHADVVGEHLAHCTVFLALIGRDWRPELLRDPGDQVRVELAAAVLRPGIVVIPLLVGGAPMPAEEQFPAELATVARRQAVKLSDRRWRADVGGLLRELEGFAPDPGHEPGHRSADTARDRRRRWIAAAALAGLVVTAVVASRLTGTDADAAYGADADYQRLLDHISPELRGRCTRGVVSNNALADAFCGREGIDIVLHDPPSEAESEVRGEAAPGDCSRPPGPGLHFFQSWSENGRTGTLGCRNRQTYYDISSTIDGLGITVSWNVVSLDDYEHGALTVASYRRLVT